MTGPRRTSVMRRREAVAGYAFICPWALGFVLFMLGPLVASFVFSTWKWDLLTPHRYVGLRNYLLLLRDPEFWNSLRVTVLYSVGRVPLALALGLALAVLLNQRIRLLGLFRTVFYLPALLPMVAVSMLWMWVLNPEFGLVNWVIWKLFRIRGPGWIFDEAWVVPAFILMSLWWVGSNMLVYLAGLQGIPTELYEASEIDGAGPFAKLVHVTLPMISPVIFYNVVTTLIASFETFTQVYVMLEQRPMRNGRFLMVYLYDNAFRFFKMGYASALAWVFFALLMVLTLLVFRSSSAWVYYEGGLRR